MEIEMTLEMKREIYNKHSERPPITDYEVGLCEGIEATLDAMKVDSGFLTEISFTNEYGSLVEMTEESKREIYKKYNEQQRSTYRQEGIREGIEFVLGVVGFNE